MALEGGGGGGGASAGAIRAGKAFVEIATRDTGLSKGLADAARKVRSFGKSIAAAGGVIFGLGAGVLGSLGAAFAEMVQHFSEVQDTADRLGATAEAITALGYAADQSGSSMGEMEVAAKFMQKAIASNDPVLAKLGLSAEKLKDLPLDEQFQAIADGINAMGDETEKTTATLNALGKAGNRMKPFLKDLRELRERAKLVGDVVSSEDVSKAEQFGDLFNDIRKSIKNTMREVVISFLGGLDTFRLYVDQFLHAMQATRMWVRENKQVIFTVAAVAAGVAALGAALTALGTTVYLAGVALAGLNTLLGFIFSPAGIITAGIVGLGYLLFTKVLAPMNNGFKELQETAVSAFDAISNAVSAGRLDLAFKVLTAGLDLEWTRFVGNFKSTFVEAWHDIVFIVANLWNDNARDMLKTSVNLARATREAFGAKALPNALGFVTGLFGSGAVGQVIGGVLAGGEETLGADKLNRRLDQINAQFGAAINKVAGADREKSEAERKAALAAKQAEFDKAKAEAAKAEAEAAQKRPRPPGVGGLEFGTSAGAFSASDFRQLLGGSQVQKDQLDVLQKIEQNQREGGKFF